MQKQNKGISLLETALVLAVLAIIVLLGLNMYQKKILEIKISTSVQQMQNILKAAQNYYTLNKRWPAGEKDLAPYFNTPPLENCPWKRPDTNNPCYTMQAVNDNVNNYFSVCLNLPTSQTISGNVLNRIKMRLVNAEVKSNSTVCSFINPLIPQTTPSPTSVAPLHAVALQADMAAISGQVPGAIVSMEYTQAGQRVYLGPPCSAGLNKYVFFYSFLNAGLAPDPYFSDLPIPSELRVGVIGTGYSAGVIGACERYNTGGGYIRSPDDTPTSPPYPPNTFLPNSPGVVHWLANPLVLSTVDSQKPGISVIPYVCLISKKLTPQGMVYTYHGIGNDGSAPANPSSDPIIIIEVCKQPDI